ncbi:NUDIX domain-containing protein [Actinomyces sp. 2119]|uniref:NUDIX domain-containing protein n=1 Tax=Actinomyces lilanjuaniae TaxID=2321394 RepID=A0ABN5PSG5_9ACTO|nr:NUDIX domain-containing protein [Actinomyces lilanjuaniae]RJF44935.1 NUDIX domain-containing protein [Actinomyces sp. 2119]
MAADGRRADLVPPDWTDLLDPREWRLGPDGLPHRRAARVLVMAAGKQVLLLRGHDTADSSHRWVFTPGGGLHPGESPKQGAARELAEETGLAVGEEHLEGPVARREAVFRFMQVTCRQHELFYLLRLPGPVEVRRDGWTDLERDAVDSVGWWSLVQVSQAQARGEAVYPVCLVGALRDLRAGWDGRVVDLTDPADAGCVPSCRDGGGCSCYSGECGQ